MAVVRVVEDDASLASLWRWMLEDAGHTVVTTTRGFSLLLRPEPWEGVEIALVDLMLPEVDGADILRYLLMERPGIKAVGMTAGSEQRVLATQAELGVPVLPKPFGMRDLQEVLDAL